MFLVPLASDNSVLSLLRNLTQLNGFMIVNYIVVLIPLVIDFYWQSLLCINSGLICCPCFLFFSVYILFSVLAHLGKGAGIFDLLCHRALHFDISFLIPTGQIHKLFPHSFGSVKTLFLYWCNTVMLCSKALPEQLHASFKWPTLWGALTGLQTRRKCL